IARGLARLQPTLQLAEGWPRIPDQTRRQRRDLDKTYRLMALSCSCRSHRIYFRIGRGGRAKYGPVPVKNQGLVQANQEGPVTTIVDKTLTCRDCGIEFTFTAGEQEFYQAKGLVNEPGRCPECRALRREGRGVSRARSMHEVTCAVCGMATQVPFLPTQGRPV